MDDKTLILILSIIFVVLQFIFKYMEGKKNKEIITAFKEGFSSFEKHAELSKDTNDKIDAIDKIVSFSEGGRPLIYQSETMAETQKEMVEMTHTIARTQEIIGTMMKETRRDIGEIRSDIKEHAKECREKR